MSIQAKAELFRIHKAVFVQVENSSTSDETPIKAGINDAVILLLPDDMAFVQGIEITFKVPKSVAQERDSIAWTFYNGITPEPSEGTQDYRGIRGALGTFGSSLSLTIKIPLYEKNSIKKDSYSYFLSEVPDYSNKKIFIRLWQVMKGLSEDIYNESFEISARPIYINKGKLLINVKPPKNTEIKPYSIFIDENPIEYDKDGILLTPGIHTVSFVSDYYRNELRTVTVEKGKNSSLDIELRDISPIIKIVCPEGSEVSIDENKLNKDERTLVVSSGEHTIAFKIGNYEFVRSIQVQNGRTYVVSITIDAKITEEEQ